MPLKDVGLRLGEAAATGLRLPLAQLVPDRLQEANCCGPGKGDWSIALSKTARGRRL